MLAAGPIPQGAIIHPDLLVSPQDLAREGELGKLIEVGFEAVAFPIDELSSVSYGIQAGDHVDVLMTFSFVDIDQETQIVEPLCPPECPPSPQGDEQEALSTDQLSRFVTQLTLQDAEVLGVGRWAFAAPVSEQPEGEGEAVQPEAPNYITLMLSPQDALVLKQAREIGASIDLAVRAQDDRQPFTTQQVTLDYMLARFGISLPAKQPYAVEKLIREEDFIGPP
jgi:Flp pilus assembly protein CpaB